jgi:hypothetical protein
MIILGIDPGTVHSGCVWFDAADQRVMTAFIRRNTDLVDLLPTYRLQDAVVFEQVASYGMSVGAEVFETVFWTGRMFEAAATTRTRDRLPRKDVKLHLCGTVRAKDANIRQALIDRWGGKAAAIGTKRQPGPLHGITSHLWAALALAVTYSDLRGTR